MALKDLLEERGKLDKELRSIVDGAEKENRDLNAEEKQKFDELHTRDMGLKARIDRQSQLDKREKELAEVRDHGIDRENFPASAAGTPPRDKREQITDEESGLAMKAWACRQFGLPLSKRMKAAAIKYRKLVNRRYSPDARHFDVRLGSNEQFRSLQNEFRTRHPNLQKRDVALSGAASLLPQGFVNKLEIALLAFGPMWQTSEVLTTNDGNALPWPTANDTGNKGELLTEATTIGSSVDPTFSSVTLNAYKFSSKLVKISVETIEDSAFDLVSFLGDALGERIGRITNDYFTTGSGTSQPNGIVTASTLGVTAASSSAIAPDELFDLQHSVDPAYRSGAGWMMKDGTLGVIRKLKDSQNQYLFQPGLQLGVPDRLLGDSININQSMEGMDDSGDTTDAAEIILLYGQLSKYKARRVRQIRLRRLVERYADTDQEGFVAFLRADGDLLDAGTHPIKHLKLHA